MTSMTPPHKALRCAIHVHTRLSDGGGTREEAIADAEAAGVDALLFSDHFLPRKAVDGFPLRCGKVLVEQGVELRTSDNDHLLVFGVRNMVATRRLPTPAALNLLARLELPFFVAHPQGRPHCLFFNRRHQWRYWYNPHYTGLEIWSYMHDWIANASPRRIPDMCRTPDAYITGPDRQVLAYWDAVAETRRVSGFGGLDAHAKRLPLGLGSLCGWARDGILPYRQNFAAFSTYALVPEQSHDDAEELRGVISALGTGKCWACHDGLADGRDFRFYSETESGRLETGSETRFAVGTVRLRAELPQEATACVMSKGEKVAEFTGKTLEFAPAVPGAYRLEVYLAGRPWIFSNHIYLR